MRLVGVGAGAGVFAQLGLEVRVDRSGFDEADQAVGEVRCLGPGGQPDGQPTGGEVVDDGAAAVGFGDAVVDEALVQGEVGERTVLGQLVAGSSRGPYAVIGLIHGSGGVPEAGTRHVADMLAASCWSVGCLAVGLPTGLFLLAVGVAGRLGDPGDRIGCGQAEFSGPALDVGPEPVPLGQVAFGGGVGQGHRGDGGVAVQGLAGEPGHFPAVPVGCVPGGVGALVAGHGGVVDFQGHDCSLPGRGHGSASRSGSGSRWRSWPVCRASQRLAPAAGKCSLTQSLALTTTTYSGGLLPPGARRGSLSSGCFMPSPGGLARCGGWSLAGLTVCCRLELAGGSGGRGLGGLGQVSGEAVVGTGVLEARLAGGTGLTGAVGADRGAVA